MGRPRTRWENHPAYWMAHRSKDPAIRFWSWVKPPDAWGCRRWRGSFKGQYGVFRWAKEAWPAHRFAFVLEHGAIPIDYFICHKCDVPSCVNPDHLFLGTIQENVADMMAKGRNHGAKTDPVPWEEIHGDGTGAGPKTTILKSEQKFLSFYANLG